MAYQVRSAPIVANVGIFRHEYATILCSHNAIRSHEFVDGLFISIFSQIALKCLKSTSTVLDWIA